MASEYDRKSGSFSGPYNHLEDTIEKLEAENARLRKALDDLKEENRRRLRIIRQISELADEV